MSSQDVKAKIFADVDQVVASLKDADGFLIGFTIFDKKAKKLTHRLITHNFPRGDILPSIKAIRDHGIREAEGGTGKTTV